MTQKSTPTCKGIPYEEGGTVPGTSLAPMMLQDYWNSNGLPGKIETSEKITSTAQVRSKVAEAMKSRDVPLFIGGDHSITLPILEELNKAEKSQLHLIILDAHTDAFDKDPSATRNWDFITRIIDKLPDVYITVLGARSHHHKTISSPRLKVVSTEDLLESDASVKRLLGPSGNRFYISIDVDVLDPSFMPAVQSPIGGGLTTQQLLQLFSRLIRPGLVGVDITEFNPLLDEGRVGMATFSYLVDRVLYSIAKVPGKA